MPGGKRILARPDGSLRTSVEQVAESPQARRNSIESHRDVDEIVVTEFRASMLRYLGLRMTGHSLSKRFVKHVALLRLIDVALVS
jgi:hypothetical protein